MDKLTPLATEIGEALKARGHTVAVAESSTGGLVSAALLSVPGASAYFLGGAVVCLPWMILKLMAYTQALLGDLPRYAR